VYAEEKAILRKSFLAMREALSENFRQSLSIQVCAWVEKDLASVSSLMAYWPFRGEVDVRGILGRWIAEGRMVWLPRVHGREIEVVRVRDLERDLQPGRFGILEPVGEAVSVIPEVILVPGVAFDRAGYRLGYGGGFYDRFLSRMKGALTIGVAYGFQVVERLPHGEHDSCVDRVVCETGWIKNEKT